jgi:aromatic ring-opening dioxygenase catalytic subunit (LigB family)
VNLTFEPASPAGAYDEFLARALSRARGQRDWMPCAHPTADHYIPLFVTLGAADQADGPVRTTIDGYMIGFSKRSFQTASAEL